MKKYIEASELLAKLEKRRGYLREEISEMDPQRTSLVAEHLGRIKESEHVSDVVERMIDNDADATRCEVNLCCRCAECDYREWLW